MLPQKLDTVTRQSSMSNSNLKSDESLQLVSKCHGGSSQKSKEYYYLWNVAEERKTA